MSYGKDFNDGRAGLPPSRGAGVGYTTGQQERARHLAAMQEGAANASFDALVTNTMGLAVLAFIGVGGFLIWKLVSDWHASVSLSWDRAAWQLMNVTTPLFLLLPVVLFVLGLVANKGVYRPVAAAILAGVLVLITIIPFAMMFSISIVIIGLLAAMMIPTLLLLSFGGSSTEFPREGLMASLVIAGICWYFGGAVILSMIFWYAVTAGCGVLGAKISTKLFNRRRARRLFI